MEAETDNLLQEIEENFQRIASPFPEWEACENPDDFTRTFGEDFFSEFWRYMHDDFEVTRFLLPFVLKYFLAGQATSDYGLSADLFIGTLDEEMQEKIQKKAPLDRLSSSLTQGQRTTVCHWLRVMRRKDPLLVNVDSAINYWCESHTEK